ncbi:T9SS type B sorting domain-containing protein [Flavobacterium nitrogenifigens]|uniref:Gliding motility-associated C-terminal domain-containing protein n=1 Tax=Flavobacterium nitrogenifigens TaxID=1617283 RepID=A0A521DK93_9FLAO|nr:T9SS type B sorting domain-containing protein [Flavobacterium nitrogenifigens]KAF2330031.1 T9SS type B sorting domain-containing protein [Flavobacterium nitrogenifigens]SMO72117.1 gliding motility-associated C-terminal domain-containing protein [Flavobacterium nitrogenifigens]
MKRILLVLFLTLSASCYSQENCNNGIDDDGDGKIDLNDEDCTCNKTASILSNSSFEEKTNCPQNYDDIPTSTYWTKGTIPSPDYLNKDCYLFSTIYSKNLQNFPDGKGIFRAVYKNNKKEYIATKLSSLLSAGTNYQLTLNIATLMSTETNNLSKRFDFNFLAPTYVTLYGCNNKDNLPLNTTSDPNSFDSSWIEIGKVLYQPQTAWGEITINFTTSIAINAIMLGPEKILPPSFNTDYEPSFLYDNLKLNTAENFGVTIVQSGNFCNNDLLLTANLTKTMSSATTFQWYKNGIAINGATNKIYAISSVKTNLGEYAVKVTDENDCFISPKLTINNSILNPSVTVTQPTCQDTNGYIKVNEPGIEYSFDKGLPFLSDDNYVTKDLVWQANANFATKEYGKYYVQTRTASGCISTPTIVTINPPILLDRPTFSIIQPTCNSGGTITITTPGSQFSFDDGLTWENSATKTNLPTGTYLLKIKNSSGCESYSQSVLLFPSYINSPNYTLTHPTCNQGGTITITSPASEYSFDNGETWTINPMATNLPSGYYNVRIKDQFGCISKPYFNQIYLNSFSKPYPEVKVTQPKTCSNTGSIVFSKTSYEYSIDNGQTWQKTPAFNNLRPGNYVVKTKNGQGCESEFYPVKINFYLSKPTYTTINPTCTTNGSITITSSASEYSFDNGETWTTNPTADNLPAGSYNIRIKNELGCESNDAYVYLPAFYLNEPTYKIINPNCETESKWGILITTPATSYSFDGGLTWSPSPSISNLDYGTYFLKIKNSLGCESNYAIANISNAYYLERPKFSVVQPTCTTPGRVTITTPAAFYSFDDGATWGTDPNLTKYPNGAVSGFLRIKNKIGCISENDWFSLNPNFLNTPTYTIVQPTTCDSNATGSITITTPAALYSFDGGLNWSTNPTASNLPVGFKYQLKIKNNEGCESGNLVVEFTPVRLKEVDYKATSPSCGKGGSITITTPAPFYSFDGGETWGTNPTASNLPLGFYYPKIKNESGCISETLYSVNFTEEYLSNFNIQVTQPTCESKNKGSITIDPLFDQYSFDGGRTWSQYNTATNLSPGNYSIVVKNNLGCESWWRVATLYDFYLPKPDYTTTPPTCEGASITIITPAASYSFDNGENWTTNPTAVNLDEGYHFIIVKNELGCQSYPLGVYISKFYLNEPLFTFTQPNCEIFGSIKFTSSASQYSIDNGDTWTTNPLISNLKPGNYYLKIKDEFGCESNSKYISLNDLNPAPEQPNIVVQQPSSCTSAMAYILVTTNAYQYSFDDGITWSTNSQVGKTIPGDYFVRIRNSATGCPSPSTKAIINPALDAVKVPTYTVSQPISCTNPFGTVTITTLASKYSFDNGITWKTSPDSENLAVGNYKIKIQNAAGCESEAVSITINAPTDYPAIPTNSIIQPNCNNSQGKITILTTASEYSFDNGLNWSNNATSTFLNPGEYYLKIKNANGCVSEPVRTTIIAFVNSIPLPENANPKIFCIQENATLDNIQMIGNNIKWYNAQTGGTPLVNTTLLQNDGAYFASQTIDGCESLRVPISVTIQNTLTPTGNANQQFCTGQNPTIANLDVTGTLIKWYDALTNGKLLAETTNLENGKTYYASQTENSCESPRFGVTVSIVNTPSAPSGNGTQEFCKNENPTLEDIQMTEQNLKWYDTHFSAAPLPNTTLLENDRTYYASQTIGCESDRTPILVKVYNTPLPTGNNNQQFCIDEIATIEDLRITGTALKWYSASINGNILQETDLLQNGKYYVTQTLNNCESERLPITVKVQDTPIPIADSPQQFCIQKNVKISDIAINGQNIKWYESSTSTGKLSESTPLENGITYYASQTISNCESDRIPVTISILEATAGNCIHLVNELPYPKFFTPNGDGFNDTWTIDPDYLAPNSSIRIFDRYGKLIKELALNTSWNGTYLGNQQPASDYWFTVTRINGTEYRGHFSLKR